jgi:hypothetical protein
MMTKLKQNLQLEKIWVIFSIKNSNYLSLDREKDVQAKGEAFSSQKRASNTSKHEIF